MAEEKTTGPPFPTNTTKDDAEPSTSDAGTGEASNVVEENFSATEESIKEAEASERQLPEEVGPVQASESQADLASVETPSTSRVSQDLMVVATAAVAVPIAKADGTGQDQGQGSRRVGDECGEVIGHSHDLETPPNTPMAGGTRVCEGFAGSSPPHDVRVMRRRRRTTCERLYDCEECAKSYVQRGRCRAVHRRRSLVSCLVMKPDSSLALRSLITQRHLMALARHPRVGLRQETRGASMRANAWHCFLTGRTHRDSYSGTQVGSFKGGEPHTQSICGAAC
ncbi:uncharacterized protein [Dermacentor albipictus]|uniref:uncharacterized protein isoform X2 n=1 Tax=Dermacentor albipictus TaxID=60249 RepID=UPI0038FD12A1